MGFTLRFDRDPIDHYSSVVLLLKMEQMTNTQKSRGHNDTAKLEYTWRKTKGAFHKIFHKVIALVRLVALKLTKQLFDYRSARSILLNIP